MVNDAPSTPPEPRRDIQQWIEEARKGSKEALGQLFEAYRQHMLKIANDELPSDLQAKGGASDLVQESFYEAQRDMDQFQGGSPNEFYGWLMRILQNNVANMKRDYGTMKRNVSVEVPIDPDGGLAGAEPAAATPSPSGHAIAREENQAVEAALKRLSDEQRLVIQMRQRDQQSFQEIGAALNRSAEAARKVWARAIEKLQTELGISDTPPSA